MNTPLIDQLANAIGSADIGAPWTVNDYPKSVTTERYRKLAVAAVNATHVEDFPSQSWCDVGSVLVFQLGIWGSIEAEVIARTGDNVALAMQRGTPWKHVMSVDDLIKAKAVRIGTIIPCMRPRSLLSRLVELITR